MANEIFQYLILVSYFFSFTSHHSPSPIMHFSLFLKYAISFLAFTPSACFVLFLIHRISFSEQF